MLDIPTLGIEYFDLVDTDAMLEHEEDRSDPYHPCNLYWCDEARDWAPHALMAKKAKRAREKDEEEDAEVSDTRSRRARQREFLVQLEQKEEVHRQ